ncbi:hypothetical protein KCU61_g4844, partial [Aureobasidium melanogenum]
MSTNNVITSYFKSTSGRKRPSSPNVQQKGFRRPVHHQKSISQPNHHQDDLHQPTKPEKDFHQPSKPQKKFHQATEPEKNFHQPTKPEKDFHQPSKPQKDFHQSTKLQKDVQQPAKPQKGFRQPPGLSLLSPTSSPYPPRTEDAITDVVNDLSQYISRNKNYVNHGQVKLLEKHGALGLRERILRGMPTALKNVLGQESGIDYYELAALENHPTCKPDKNHVGSYFVGGTPITSSPASHHSEEALLGSSRPDESPLPRSLLTAFPTSLVSSEVLPPGFSPTKSVPDLPAYGGETGYVTGLKGRAGNHLSLSYRQNQKPGTDKLLYKIIDDPVHPLKPFVVSTCKETVIDKDFERFAEAVTRQLLGTNVESPLLKDLNALPSYRALKFIQSIIPTNGTNVLREGYAAGETEEELRERAEETERRNAAQRKVYRATTGRFLHTCLICGTTESQSSRWHYVKGDEESDDRVCGRCHAYHNYHGSYPDLEALLESIEKTTYRVEHARTHEPPGYCENEHCEQEGSSEWIWATALMRYLCRTCYTYARLNDNALRVPQFRNRTAHEKTLPCANDMCKTYTPTKWSWSEVKQALSGKDGMKHVGKHEEGEPCANELCKATTASKWAWNETKKGWICVICYNYLRTRSGAWRVPTKDKRGRKK